MPDALVDSQTSNTAAAATTTGAAGSGGAGGAPPASSAPSSTPAPSPGLPTSPTPSGGSSSPAAGGVGGAASAPGAQEYLGVLEALRGYGVDLSGQFQDDHAALQHLALAYRQAQQGNQLAQYGQLYLQHAEPFQAYLRQQQEQAARQQQEQQKGWWKAPEFDPSWRQKIARDASGNLVATQGSDPTLVPKYLQAVEHQQQFLDRFAFDPIGAIKPGIEQVAREVAQQLVQQHLGGYQETVSARGFVEDNSAWLHQRDGQGHLVRDQRTGQPALSEWGQRFQGYVGEALNLGLNTVAAQQKYALAAVQRDYLYSQHSGQQQTAAAQSQGDQAKDQFLQQAAGGQHRPNQAGSLQTPSPNGTTPSQNDSLSLQQRLARNMAAAGYQMSTPVTVGG